MKRFFSLIIACLMLLLSLVACGDRDACEHSGGKATCKDPAKCEKCGEEYGEEDEENHIGEQVWEANEESHVKRCLACNEKTGKEEAHTWEKGICSVCGYACQHSGESASCTQGSVCEFCGMLYAVKDGAVHSGEGAWETTATTHKKVYSCCGDEIFAEDAHAWVNGVCTACSYACAHKGGKATCSSLASCEICGARYGELDSSNHSGDTVWEKPDDTHREVYSCCNAVVTDSEKHDMKSGSCSKCGFLCKHTSAGEANCVNRRICDICGGAFGEKNSENHIGTIEWEISESGHKQIYTCCHKVVYEEELHKWVDGECSYCGAIEPEAETPAETEPDINETEAETPAETEPDINETEAETPAETETEAETEPDINETETETSAETETETETETESGMF